MPLPRPIAVAILTLLLTSPAAARPRPSAFTLFASPTLSLDANRVYCGLRDNGETCVDVTGGTVLGGGSWPVGSGNGYIFNSGLQIVALVPANAGFAWAGDTVGSWFMDSRGDQQSGAPVTPFYDSRRDLAAWPSAAVLRDTALFASALLGREAASEQDSWIRYWDYDNIAGRGHPMGVLVEQRTLAWNYPNGNADIIYRIYRIINVTASDPARYAGLAAYGYTSADIAELVTLGRYFQDRLRTDFGVTLPAAGYTFDQAFVAYNIDHDVGTVVSDNYSTAVLPFGMQVAYVGDFEEPSWTYPPEIFAAPFTASPGFAAEAFLRAPGGPPETRGLHIWSGTANGVLPDPNGIDKLYRYLSGTVSPATGDNSCTVANPQARHLCAVIQVQRDTRDFMSSGPFTIPAGGAVTLVMAQVYAAPVAAAIAPWVGSPSPGLQPGFPPGPAGLATGTPSYDTVRVIDRAMGWVSHTDADGDGFIEWNEVSTVPRSLLWKTQLAEAMVANRFQLPAPPEEPAFFLMPGDRQVTVVWRPSPTEQAGDPYFPIASDPSTPLYDPNYREFDVEGYRVWRGTTPNNLQLVAQFDYDRTVLTDYRGLVLSNILYGPFYGSRCAPELGVVVTCPTFPEAVPLTGSPAQVRPGDRGLLSDSSIVLFRADTAVTGRGSGYPPLADRGVPFAFVDTTVANGQTYYYAVTVFDVNSWQSGPSSFESGRTAKPSRPRVPSRQETGGAVAVQLIAPDGSALTDTTMPDLDATTGIFAGRMPVANGLAVALSTFLPQLYGGDTVTIVVDSIVPGSSLLSIAPTRYFLRSVQTGQPPSAFVLRITPYGFDGDVVFPVDTTFQVPLSATAPARFGGDSGYVTAATLLLRVGGIYGLSQKGRAWANGQSGPNNGTRWWSGTANENVTDPNGLNCQILQPSFSGCALIDLSRNAGQIPSVGVFGIQSYLTVASTTPLRNIEGVTSTVFRAADMRVYWGGNGVVDSVVDLTHRVRVPFSPKIRASWGILTTQSFTATTAASTADGNNALITWSDLACIDPIPAMLAQCGGATQTPAALQNQAALSPVWFASSTYAGTAGQTANGTGFLFYLNGTFTLFRLTSLPPAGATWNARFYAGNIAGVAGSYSYFPAVRPAAVPGLAIRLTFSGTTFDPAVTTADELARVHTVPDPYYGTHALEFSEGRQLLRFVNVPAQSVIRVYSTSGVLVAILSHNDATGGGEVEWNVRNRTGTAVASGVYFWHLETPDGRRRVGRFTIVNGDR